MAMGRIEHTLLDEGAFIPNRPKTIACNPTIPQKVTNVSIHDKGPEPSRLESSDPMREAGALSTTGSLRDSQPALFHAVRHGVLYPSTGGSHGLTTRALKLLMSIGIPVENTKRLQPPRAPTLLVQRSGRDGGGRPRPDYSARRL